MEWFSENAAILRVDANGQATALAGGVAAVHAKVNGVKSNSVDLTVGADRAGTFVPAGGYAAGGTAMLRTENGQVILDLGPNFRTSFALGTTSTWPIPPTRAWSAQRVSKWRKFARMAPIPSTSQRLNGNVGLFDYRYVVILCKPATVTFGYADLN
jgi:hypothetical protein